MLIQIECKPFYVVQVLKAIIANFAIFITFESNSQNISSNWGKIHFWFGFRVNQCIAQSFNKNDFVLTFSATIRSQDSVYTVQPNSRNRNFKTKSVVLIILLACCVLFVSSEVDLMMCSGKNMEGMCNEQMLMEWGAILSKSAEMNLCTLGSIEFMISPSLLSS